MRGLTNSTSFYDLLTATDRKVVQALAEIELEDANRCSHCGGEDCMCCEYYLDRQKWQTPEEMFSYAFDTVPDFESDEFREWCEMFDLDPEDLENWSDFAEEWRADSRPEFLY